MEPSQATEIDHAIALTPTSPRWFDCANVRDKSRTYRPDEFFHRPMKALPLIGCIQGPEQAAEKGLVHGSAREEFPQGLRKKSERKANLAKDGSAGAKARLILLALSARLKPCPCYKAPWLSSAACEDRPIPSL
jgi:hypothetical protein